jgi:hypothetical protein
MDPICTSAKWVRLFEGIQMMIVHQCILSQDELKEFLNITNIIPDEVVLTRTC